MIKRQYEHKILLNSFLIIGEDVSDMSQLTTVCYVFMPILRIEKEKYLSLKSNKKGIIVIPGFILLYQYSHTSTHAYIYLWPTND